MELQALRYAGMVSSMTFDQVVDVYAAYLHRRNDSRDARSRILEFLDWEEPDEDRFAQEVRIVLVAAEFGKELTTAVMWLNERDLDIRCIRMRPYSDNGRLLVDVQQVIPLPEAEEYMVKIRQKEVRERSARREQTESGKMLHRFWTELLDKARIRTDLHARISPGTYWWLGAGAGRRGLALNYAFGKENPRVELYIDTGDGADNKRIFDQLVGAKAQVEGRFQGTLGWERLEDKRACRIRADFGAPSVIDENGWPEIQDKMISTMIRFEQALRPELDKLR